MRIAILDTYYPAFLDSLNFNPAAQYESELREVLSYEFGTSSFYSDNLRALGHQCIDIIANYPALQMQWAREHGWMDGATSLQAIALEQIKAFEPDVVFLQDLSFFDPATLRMLSDRYTVAAQCSCPWPGDALASKPAVVWTSFPHYVPRFKALGVPRVEYMPLAFEPRMLQECVQQERDLDITIVGGMGRNSHWQSGTDTLEMVAERFGKRFHWYGYGLDNLDSSSALRACWRGEAYGKDMYRIYGRSKIVVTRHGEVANGFTNNLRVYEATGMGALLMTEDSTNLDQLFPSPRARTRSKVCAYIHPDDLCTWIEYYLDHEPQMIRTAKAGQEWTLQNHTYAHRMKQVSEVLTECLEARQVAQ